jgi:outer membrane protein
MKTTTRAAALILAALLSSSAVSAAEEVKTSGAAGTAQTAPTTEETAARPSATLAKAREGALALSRTLRKYLLSVDAAKLVRKAQNYEMLPSLSATASGGTSYAADSASALSTSLKLSASQTVFDGGQNAILAAIDDIDVAVARAQARSAYFTAVMDAEQAYYAALEAYAAEDAAQRDLEASRLHLELAKAKLDAGIIARPAYLEIESEVATKETARNSARKTSLTAARKLSSLTGLTLGATLEDESSERVETLAARVASLSDSAADTFADALLAAAAKGNPDMEQAVLATTRAEKEISYAKRAALPTISAGWSNTSSYDADSGLNLVSGSVSLSATISLDPWTVSNSVAQKRIAADEAALDEAEERSTLDLDVRTAVYEAVSDARAIASSKKALEYAERNYESQLEAFKLSTISSSTLSDAEVSVSSARSSLISARYSFLSGLSSLRALSGFDDASLLEAALP